MLKAALSAFQMGMNDSRGGANAAIDESNVSQCRNWVFLLILGYMSDWRYLSAVYLLV